VKSALLLLPGAFSGIGGIEMYNRQVILAFLELGKERNFDVRAYVLNDNTRDVDGRYIPVGSSPPRGFRRHRSAFVVAAMAATLQHGPDVIVFGHVHFARLASVLRRLSPGSRQWYLVYGIEVWRPLPASTRRGLALADKILSISDFSRNELARNGGPPAARIDILPCALDPIWQAQYAPRPGDPARLEDGRPTLLTVARLAASERYKGIDSVLRALPDVAKVVPDVLYKVVGDGDDRPRLEALARDLGVASSVLFLGRLLPDQLAAVYRDCTLFAMPSSREGFGIVFLEAALFRKPSVAGRHGGSPEVVEDGVTGTLVDHEDVSGTTRTLIRLLLNPEECTRMGEAAHQRLLERFTYPSFREALAVHVRSVP
jgi:glycosyltransferase involved in cell wall biosynthesis